MVISLKKYWDLKTNELEKCLGPEPPDVLAATLESYRAALLAFGNNGFRACPAVGEELPRNMLRVAERLSGELTVPALQESAERVDQQLQRWGDSTSEYLQQKAREIKDILIVLTRTAESLAERDQHYAKQFSTFASRLQQMANLDDLPKIRSSLVQSATELKGCVERMEEDGRESAGQLQAEVLIYQQKLEEAEQRASRDALTGLCNRNSVEVRIEQRIAEGNTFCVAIMDLNDFKQVNDTYGHPTGDDLLKQFSREMKSIVRSTDVVGRWGGDEFIIVLDCALAQAKAYLERQQKWVFGEYTLDSGTEKIKVDVTAAVGLAEWHTGETMNELIARADAEMYKQKLEMRWDSQPT